MFSHVINFFNAEVLF